MRPGTTRFRAHTLAPTFSENLRSIFRRLFHPGWCSGGGLGAEELFATVVGAQFQHREIEQAGPARAGDWR